MVSWVACICDLVLDSLRTLTRRTDDSALNAKAGKEFGWKTTHLVEPDANAPPEPVADHQIQNLEHLRDVYPELFKKDD